MFPKDIISVLVTLMSSQWNPNNTLNIIPKFGVGQTETQGPPHQVLVRNVPSEDATGTSGVHGINPGGGNNQLLRGMVFVNCIAEEGDGLPDIDEVTNAFVRELMRIIRANMNSVAGYDYISFLGYNRIPPQQGDHPFRVTRSCRIGFQFRIED